MNTTIITPNFFQLAAKLSDKEITSPIKAKDRGSNDTLSISKKLLIWAVETSGKEINEIEGKNIGIDLIAWLTGEKSPTIKQLQKFADRTYTSIPLLLLNSPIKETLPIKDFRLLNNQDFDKPKRNLLDTIYDCQLKQDWYRRYCISEEFPKLDIVDSCKPSQNIHDVVHKLRNYLSLGEHPIDYSKYVTMIERAGILVMSTGTVKGNTHRKLSLEDVRGFALHDEYAPVIFVNANESISGKKFTLIHELAHIAIGISGISNNYTSQSIKDKTELWCNKVATEMLVPENMFRDIYIDNQDDPFIDKDKLARKFKVSTLLIMLRIRELGYYKGADSQFWQEFKAEKEHIMSKLGNKSGGGNYYNTTPIRNSKRLCKALTAYTLADKTLYRDAMKLLNIRKPQTLMTLMNKL